MDIASFREARNLEIVPITRGQLIDLMARLHRAEGMTIEQARIHAEMLVEQHILQLKNGY